MNKVRKNREQILLDIVEKESSLQSIQDVDILLEQILTEARRVVNADAGSIYIVDNQYLRIKHAQNDTLQNKIKRGEKLPYVSFSFPIDSTTIAGYVASTKNYVNEADVYHIDSDKTYKFGKQSDTVSGYRTVSNLTMPLINTQGKVLGVLQVLNAKDENGDLVAFSSNDEIYLSHFASNACLALERAYLMRSIILRMIRMSELRDPCETGLHIKRVASYSVEIYDRWAFNHNIPESTQMKFRDVLKIAAMLHDVGKVAISDTILKKPEKLSSSEYTEMQKHTWLGATLFLPLENDIDEICSQVALRHHEKWDGSGYPGKIDPNTGEPTEIDSKTGKARGLAGEEIPIEARIVAIADVYDALSAKRAYKPPLDEDVITSIIKESSNSHFDPEIVKAFFEVLPRIQAIKKHYSEKNAFND